VVAFLEDPALAERVHGRPEVRQLLGGVDFPRFAQGLIDGVFQAVVDSTVQQMRAYAEMLAGVAASLDELEAQAGRDPAEAGQGRAQLLATLVLLGIERIVVAAGAVRPKVPVGPLGPVGRGGAELLPFGTWTVRMERPVVLAGTPVGTRVIVEFREIVATGRVAGKRRGPVAADWLRIGPDSTATLDIRFCLETDDGAVVYVHGDGHTDATRFATGAPTWFVPRFETADPRYAWLHRVMVVAKGTADGDTVVFELVEVR
jgi:hypothetical protein